MIPLERSPASLSQGPSFLSRQTRTFLSRPASGFLTRPDQGLVVPEVLAHVSLNVELELP